MPLLAWGHGVLISKLRAALWAAILIAATATVTTIIVSEWNLVPPTDYEDCAARAAKDAKSTEALSVLLSICDSDFKGRRKPGGGYAYYNSCQGHASDIGRTFDIKGPNPTPDEQKLMNDQCLADIEHDDRVADQEALAEWEAAKQQAEAARKAQQVAAYQAAQERAAAAAAANALQLRKSQAIAAVHVTANGLSAALPICFRRRNATKLVTSLICKSK